jgi:hypothetical protein
LAVALAGCGSCGDGERAAGADAGRAALPAPEPWTFGAMRSQAAIALPPGCNERAPPLRAVLPRDTRMVAEPTTLGRMWVAEGAYSHGGRGPGVAVGEPFRADAAGIVTFDDGLTRATAAPWPLAGVPVLAAAGGSWLLLFDRAGGAQAQLHAWRDDHEQHLGAGLAARELACGAERCALLVKHQSAGAARWEVWLGGGAEPLLSWQRVELAGEAVAIALGDDAIAVTREGGRARFWRVRGAEAPAALAEVDAGAGPLAAVAAPTPLLLATAPSALADGCPEEGGVVVAPAGGPPVRLRAPQPAVAGALRRLGGGVLAAWRAPARCGSRQGMLYAARLGANGAATAPVTTVGVADDFAVAVAGGDVDLWLADHRDRTLSWIRASCSPL